MNLHNAPVHGAADPRQALGFPLWLRVPHASPWHRGPLAGKVTALLSLGLALLLAGCTPGSPPAPTATPAPTETQVRVAPSPTATELRPTEETLPGPGQPTETPGPTMTPPPMPADLPSKGNPDAKVVIIEFSDYQ